MAFKMKGFSAFTQKIGMSEKEKQENKQKIKEEEKRLLDETTRKREEQGKVTATINPAFKQKEYEPQTKAGGREYEDMVRRSDLDEEGKKIFDSKGYEPQTKTRGYKGSEHTDSTPQTEMQKMSLDRLEGELHGIMDNEYMEAKERGDKSEIARYESQINKLEKEIERRKNK